MQMRFFVLWFSASLFLVVADHSHVFAAYATDTSLPQFAQDLVLYASEQLTTTRNAWPPSQRQFPWYTGEDGNWEAPAQATFWTSGYLSGCLWYQYRLTGDVKWLTEAKKHGSKMLSLVDEIIKAKNPHNGPVFLMPFVGAAVRDRVPGLPLAQYEKSLVTAAAGMAEDFNEIVGCFKSWNNKKDDPPNGMKVIIDDTVALMEMMWLASTLTKGNTSWAEMALRHALNAARNHVRPDGTTYHVVTYDVTKGSIISRKTHQGSSDNSTWARGQAWAVYGFSFMAEMTGDSELLTAAKRTADTFFSRLPSDLVPPWDFDAPQEISFKDTSAAAVAAAGMQRLAKLTGDDAYSTAATQILQALATEWTSKNANWLPKPASILRNGTSNFPSGQHATGLIYGDYYMLEGILGLNAQSGVYPINNLPLISYNQPVGINTTSDASSVQNNVFIEEKPLPASLPLIKPDFINTTSDASSVQNVVFIEEKPVSASLPLIKPDFLLAYLTILLPLLYFWSFF